MTKTINNIRKQLIALLFFIFITDIVILLNIPFLRQIFGFLLLIILPGLLILQILKVNEIGFTEKFVLSVGLSASFLMFFGLLINNLSRSLSYETPLATIPLLITFNIASIALGIMGYKLNKEPIFSLPNFNLTASEKAFLIVPILFPALSIFGMHVMNTTDNTFILMFLLFLIPAYVIFVCFFNQKFPNRLYPVVIFLISISLLLMYMLRFPHIYGVDVHHEYYFFQMTLSNLHWSIFRGIGIHTLLNACLSISLLPAIYQSIMNLNAQEYLFKYVYVSICSFGPLAIYLTSKKYVGNLYAFIASFFFISQVTFLTTTVNPRTAIAIFFVALAIMVFFNGKIDPLKKRILFIVFMLSVVVSHYSTAYIFFFIMLFSWLAIEIFSKRFTFKKITTLTVVLLFFAFIFFWYSQVTETAFNAGVYFVEDTFLNLNKFFIEESRVDVFVQLTGAELTHPILSRVNLAVTWGTFILIGIGVLTMIRRYKEMVVISNVKLKKPDFLKTKFEMEYLAMALACAGLLVIMVALPFVSKGYFIHRLYLMMMIILSVCFIIGGMTLAKYFKLRPYLIILLILIPYFLFITGAIHQICGVSSSIYFNSEGEKYNREYIHDQGSYGAKWLMINGKNNSKIYIAGWYAIRELISQGKIRTERIDSRSFSGHMKLKEGYIYLYFNNVVRNKLVVGGVTHDMNEYSDMFVGKSKIYNNGGTEVWK